MAEWLGMQYCNSAKHVSWLASRRIDMRWQAGWAVEFDCVLVSAGTASQPGPANHTHSEKGKAAQQAGAGRQSAAARCEQPMSPAHPSTPTIPAHNTHPPEYTSASSTGPAAL